MEDDSAFAFKKKKPASSFLCDLLFSHVGLFVIVAAYAVLGAMAFIEFELPREEILRSKKVKAEQEINDTINYMGQVLWYYQSKNWTVLEYQDQVMQKLNELDNTILSAMSTTKYDGTVEGWNYSWTFAKTLLFTMSIITTIGYGHIFPITFFGQMFCIVYALVGCPLLLLFLANVGDAMGNGLLYIYSRCCCRWCRTTRNESELPPGSSKRQLKLLIDDDVGNEDYMPTNKLFVPITINLVMLAGFIVVGSVVFASWEKWDFHSACYFTFITISTVGYGDYYPKAVMVEDLQSDFGETLKMFFSVFYLLFGMALLSMAVNLMQDQLMEKSRWLSREIGLTKSPEQLEKEKALAKEAKMAKKEAKKAKANDPELGMKNGALAIPAAVPNKRKESVADISVPDSPGRTPSSAPTRPVSALSMLPGALED